MKKEDILNKINGLESEIEKLRSELEGEINEEPKSIEIFSAENTVWFSPKGDDFCASICINSGGDPDDENSPEWSTYNYVNFTCKAEFENFLEELKIQLDSWSE